MSQWDGNDYQFWSRAAIVVSVICLVIDRIWPGPDAMLFGLSIFFLLIAAGMVPRGPQPPAD